MVKTVWYSACTTSFLYCLYLFSLLYYFHTLKTGQQSLGTNLISTLQWALFMVVPLGLAYLFMKHGYFRTALLISVLTIGAEIYLASLLYVSYFINKDY